MWDRRMSAILFVLNMPLFGTNVSCNMCLEYCLGMPSAFVVHCLDICSCYHGSIRNLRVSLASDCLFSLNF